MTDKFPAFAHLVANTFQNMRLCPNIPNPHLLLRQENPLASKPADLR